jgi:hypothetical protein
MDLNGDKRKHTRRARQYRKGQEEMGGDAEDPGLRTPSPKDLRPFLKGSGNEHVAVRERIMEGDGTNSRHTRSLPQQVCEDDHATTCSTGSHWRRAHLGWSADCTAALQRLISTPLLPIQYTRARKANLTASYQ